MWSGLLDAYKKDLSEFVSTVAETTTSAIDAAAKAVDDTYPAGDGDGTPPASGSDGPLSDSEAEDAGARVRPASTVALAALQANIDTYRKSVQPQERRDFEAFLASFNLEAHTDAIEALLAGVPVVKQLQLELVPATLSYEDFWTRYFFRSRRFSGSVASSSSDGDEKPTSGSLGRTALAHQGASKSSTLRLGAVRVVQAGPNDDDDDDEDLGWGDDAGWGDDDATEGADPAATARETSAGAASHHRAGRAGTAATGGGAAEAGVSASSAATGGSEGTITALKGRVAMVEAEKAALAQQLAETQTALTRARAKSAAAAHGPAATSAAVAAALAKANAAHEDDVSELRAQLETLRKDLEVVQDVADREAAARSAAEATVAAGADESRAAVAALEAANAKLVREHAALQSRLERELAEARDAQEAAIADAVREAVAVVESQSAARLEHASREARAQLAEAEAAHRAALEAAKELHAAELLDLRRRLSANVVAAATATGSAGTARAASTTGTTAASNAAAATPAAAAAGNARPPPSAAGTAPSPPLSTSGVSGLGGDDSGWEDVASDVARRHSGAGVAPGEAESTPPVHPRRPTGDDSDGDDWGEWE